MLVTKVHITYAHFPGKYTEKEVQTYLMKWWPTKIVYFLCVICFSFEKNPKATFNAGCFFSMLQGSFKGFMASLDS